MRKILLLLTAVILGYTRSACAQADTIRSYMRTEKKSGYFDGVISVTDVAEADFLRIVTTPDSSAGDGLFQVYDYYLNGKLKLRGGSVKGAIHVVLDGSVVEFYPDGHKKRIAQYSNGTLIGNFVDYYPNGKVYLSGTHGVEETRIDSCNDVTGHMLAERGNGRQVVYDGNFKETGGGALFNGHRNGSWKYILNDSLSYEIQYDKGKIVSGISYDNKGKKYSFLKEETPAVFMGRGKAFTNYITEILKYPFEAAEKHVQGRVVLGFDVDKDGAVKNIKILHGIGFGCDEAAVTALRLCPRWTPAKYYGIPLITHVVQTVNFSLDK